MATDIAVRQEYRYLQAWARVGGYTQEELEALLKQAYEEHAPYDALFKRRHSGVWATFRTHCKEGLTISNEFVRIFDKNGWGKPVHKKEN